MKNKHFLCAITFIYLTNSAHGTSDNTYITPKLGITSISTSKVSGTLPNNSKLDYKKSPILSISIGKIINNKYDVEMNVTHGSYKNNNSLNSKIINTNLHLGFNYNLMDSATTPYIMAGGGMSINTVKPIAITSQRYYMEKTKISPSAFVGIGGKYKISRHMNLDIAYKYTHMGSIATKANLTPTGMDNTQLKFRADQHAILFGARYIW